MARLTHFSQAAAGLGAISFDTGDIAKTVVKAFMPALRSELPGLVDVAMPHLEGKMPLLIKAALPQIQYELPGLVQGAVPMITKQLPSMIDTALPIVQAKLPSLTKSLMPILRTELEGVLDDYAKTYLGPTAQFKEWAPALAMVAATMTLFASGIVIYQFWSGKTN